MTGINSYVDQSAQVFASELEDNAKVYKSCYVNECYVKKNSIIGDFTRIERTTLGENVRLQRNGMIYDSNIGKYTYTGRNFTAWHCSIGSFCSISWNVSIGGANHDFRRVTTHAMLYSSEFGLLNGREPIYNRFADKCIIGNDVWIGCNAVIMRGVHVGNGAVIGAGSVVIKDIEPYSIVAGVPAKKINMRFDKTIADRLNITEWWNLPNDIIMDNLELFGSAVDNKTIELIEKLCDRYK